MRRCATLTLTGTAAVLLLMVVTMTK